VKAPTALSGTSPKYDDENFVCAFILHLVVFGGGRRGLARACPERSRRVESLPPSLRYEDLRRGEWASPRGTLATNAGADADELFASLLEESFS
jgi:hypothetical protein